MLWLCIHLPRLSLELFQCGDRIGAPLAIVEGATIMAVSHSAAMAGLRPGLSLSAAGAILPQLRQRERDRAAEIRALERLADWSLQYTSKVSLQPPWSLLLEIGGSLRYFGGLECLRGRLREGLRSLGHHHPTLAIAPTPTAALLLARAGCEQPVTQRHRLVAALAALPVRALDLSGERRTALRNLGLHTLGDCFALPRDGFSRRFGVELLHQLDRARGDLADPRRHWRSPPRFRGELELPDEVHDVESLLFAANRLILELCGYLRGIEAGTRRFWIRLHHRRRSATALSIGLMTPNRDAAHLLDLTRRRLERHRLAAPVTGLTLTTAHIRPLPPRYRTLIADPRQNAAAGRDTLLEQLSARLGERAIKGLQIREEHRPERAWQYVAPGREGGADPAIERPLWLLLQPTRLEAHAGRPLWGGPLVLLRGPERIESGWWDGDGIARDYYVAGNRAGERVWIFHERGGGSAWYLHGIFA